MDAKSTRIESDTMGQVEIPEEALWGASTQRAVDNFRVSDRPLDPTVGRHLGLIKSAAAEVNGQLGAIPGELVEVIREAAEQVYSGKLDPHLVVDTYQTGSGTSTNMNVNEVIANRCSQVAGEPPGSKRPVHPNDHVNQSQSSNDTFPTAVHLAVSTALRDELAPALEGLHRSLSEKAASFGAIHKIGRTHLMDATPIRLDQEFGGFARQVELGRRRVETATEALLELPLGGTAVGTGLNCPEGFAGKVVAILAERTGIPFREAEDHFEAQSARDGLVEASGQLKTIATSLFKISNDLRWLASGPRCGLAEIRLPPTQPGSSIMPGKVNPVMAESMMQVCGQVIGNDAAVTWGGANGNLQLNVMMPLMARNVLESIRFLSRAADGLRERCIDGIEADRERCERIVEESLSLVTSLAPRIGYDKASELAKRALAEERTIRELCLELDVLPAEELDSLLDPGGMV